MNQLNAFDPEFFATRTDLLGWFVQQAAPLWSTTGTDWDQGGFHEKLDGSGDPVQEARRTRVVARQLYVFSVAKRLGWAADHRRWVAHGLDFLLNRLQQADHTFASSVTPQGQVVNATFDLYEQAFAMFAMASVFRLDPTAFTGLRANAERVLDTVKAGWGHPQIGFEESAPRTLPLRSNPHMHLFEAALQWAEALPKADNLWWRLADELAELALTRLIDRDSGLVTELFDGDWQPMPGADGTLTEPGHQFEWGWLLIRWGRARQRNDAIAAAQRMIGRAEQHGICPQRGVAINEINTDLSWRDANAKLWPQTERVKAWVACAELAVQQADRAALAQALERATAAMQGMRAYLHHPVAGAWQEVWLADGSWKVEPTRASSLYHIVCALDTLHAAGDLTLADQASA